MIFLNFIWTRIQEFFCVCVIVIKSMLYVLCAICHFPPALPLTPYQLVLTALNSNIMSSDIAHNSRVKLKTSSKYKNKSDFSPSKKLKLTPVLI